MTDMAKKTDFVYAGFFIRLFAFVVDMIVIRAINSIIQNFVSDTTLFNNLTTYDLIFWLICLGYFTLMTYFTKGQTLGKIIANIKVISLDGDLSFGQVVSRETFGRYIQNKLMILYLIAGFAKKKQSLVDMISDTVVVRLDAYNYINDL